MTVETATQGKVEVSESRIITIPEGLFGFEEYTKFALIESGFSPFIWLQSLSDKNLAFLLIDPFLVDETYEADIDDKELLKIGLTDSRDVILLTVVTVPGGGEKVTANFQGPLVINRRNHTGMQVILDNPKYTTKHDIAGMLQAKRNNPVGSVLGGLGSANGMSFQDGQGTGSNTSSGIFASDDSQSQGL